MKNTTSVSVVDACPVWIVVPGVADAATLIPRPCVDPDSGSRV